MMKEDTTQDVSSAVEDDSAMDEFDDHLEETVGFLEDTPMESMEIAVEDDQEEPVVSFSLWQWARHNGDLALVCVSLVLASLVGGVVFWSNDWHVTTTTSTSSLRRQLASASIAIMKQDTMENFNGQKQLDITEFANDIQVALQKVGIRGVCQLLQAPEFAQALNEAAAADASCHVQANPKLLHQHNVVQYTHLASSRRFEGDEDGYCSGCFEWLGQYAGAVAASQFLQDGYLFLDESRQRLESAADILQEIRQVQRTIGKPEWAVLDVAHGFVQEIVTQTWFLEEKSWVSLGEELCGDVYGNSVFVQDLNADIGVACHKALGSALWHVSAKRKYQTTSVHTQHLPRGRVGIPKEDMCQVVDLCLSTSDLSHEESNPASGCLLGFTETLTWMGEEHLTEEMTKLVLTQLCSDKKPIPIPEGGLDALPEGALAALQQGALGGGGKGALGGGGGGHAGGGHAK